MNLAAPAGRSGDDPTSVAFDDSVRRFEAAWRAGASGRRPDFRAFVATDTPSARLALARADLALRWESGERAGAERYAELDLPEDARVELVYEEYCLREEAGESPNPEGFYARFPDLARALRRVLDIHALVGSAHASSTVSFGSGHGGLGAPFPEAGQTIAGFHLVEELGRGGFARVFLARERQLGDRPVALKVARAGSREPQTLARLQHTHIVPVHSYRIDPATGLHLLCMPYFGRVTLAHVLADPAVKEARSGSEIVTAIDRLNHESDATLPSGRSDGRMALGARPYARAVAWWGARLAEALQHAHDRGVLHRDIKPSNVLVTPDGMPMLLDFNLAHDPLDAASHGEPAALGGTIAYMAPEQLEALAEGGGKGGDLRADLYALGVVLFEAMGARPFGPPPTSRSVPEALLRAAEGRRANPPALRERFPEAPPALAAVVEKCLAPDPSDRYESAADLAEDLQAVAEDLPLVHAREPIGVRLMAKVRRHRRAMAATAVVLIALGLAAFWAWAAHTADRQKRQDVQYYIAEGNAAMAGGQYTRAGELYDTAVRLAQKSPGLGPLHARARGLARAATFATRTKEDAARFLATSEAIRFALLGFDDGKPSRDLPKLADALAPFFVLESADWAGRDELFALTAEARSALVREVHAILLLAAIQDARASDPTLKAAAIALCDKARALRHAARSDTGRAWEADTLPEGPWEALRASVVATLNGSHPSRAHPPAIAAVDDADEAYAWSHVLMLEDGGASPRVVAWIDRAARLAPGRFLLAFEAAYRADRAGLSDNAMEHYNVAVDLRPEAPRPRVGRARMLRARGQWGRAREDLDRALREAPGLVEALMERGVVAQSLGDFATARRDYDALIARPDAGVYRPAAILNRARLDADRGDLRSALAALDGLIQWDPRDATARLARASLLLRQGDAARAEVDLDAILRDAPEHAEALALRSLSRLALGHPEAAWDDAERAARLDPSARRERLRARAALALGRFASIAFDDPESVLLLPSGGRPLAPDLRAAADALGRGEPSTSQRSTRAVLLASLGDARGAEAEAGRAIAEAPLSPRTWLVRARIRRFFGDRRGAQSDAESGLAIEPDEPRLLGVLGLLRVESGEARAALTDLERASRRGAGGPALDRPIAEARTRLGDGRAAVADWNRALAHDADDPALALGRARAFLQSGDPDSALADLERAAQAAEGRPDVLLSVALIYARSLPARPDRIGRVLALAGRGLAPASPLAKRG